MSRQDLKAKRGGCRRAVDILRMPRATVASTAPSDRRSGLEGRARDRRHGLAVDHVADAFFLQFGKQRAARRDWPETCPISA